MVLAFFGCCLLVYSPSLNPENERKSVGESVEHTHTHTHTHTTHSVTVGFGG